MVIPCLMQHTHNSAHKQLLLHTQFSSEQIGICTIRRPGLGSYKGSVLCIMSSRCVCCILQALVHQCHTAGVDLRSGGLQPGIQLVAAHLNADQAIALLGLVPAAPTSPALAAARQALEITAAQASSHEAMYYCTVRLRPYFLTPTFWQRVHEKQFLNKNLALM